MEHRHSEYRGWKLCITPDGPPDAPRYLGHGVRATPPHEVIMTRDSTEAAALDRLYRQVDAMEDAGAKRTGVSAHKPPSTAPWPRG
jgi:hypothetical protein